MKYQYAKGQRFLLKAHTSGYGFLNDPRDRIIEITGVNTRDVSYAYLSPRDSGYSKEFAAFDRAIDEGRLVPQFALLRAGGVPADATPINSAAILQAGIDVQAERGKSRDSATGERSMKRTVDAFNALEGTTLTEVQGWRFMAVLKLARSVNGDFNVDDYIDGASYMSLAGESAGLTPKVV